MKGSIIVLLFFAAGCLLGVMGWLPFNPEGSNLTLYMLYALMLQVGLSIGSSKDLKFIVGSLRPKYLLIPLGTVCGTLLFSALASLLLSRWSIFDCMAVGSGFAYYSLSSILITQFKEPSIGLQLATELGTIALLANIFREMMALLGTPLLCKYFGKLAPISAAGVNSMDVVHTASSPCRMKMEKELTESQSIMFGITEIPFIYTAPPWDGNCAAWTPATRSPSA